MLVSAARYWSALLLAALAAAAQAPPAESFEDLARRAQATIDSQPAESANLFKQALALKPDWAEGWLYMGGALYQLNRYAEATDALRKGLDLAPQMGTGWALLGLTEAELGDSDQAVADIRKGEGLGLGDNYPFERAARVRAAQLLVKASSYDEAQEQLRPLAKHNDDSIAVILTMGLCVLSMPESIADISAERRAVVELAGRAAWTSVTLHPEQAAALYKQLVERYPNQPGVRYAHGLYLMETDLGGALAEFHKELEHNPAHWPTLIITATLETRRGSADAAIECIRRAMKAAPAKYRWLCHTELGRAQMESDHLDAAISEFETALRLNPSIANIHFFLSEAYRRAGRKTDADRERAEFEKLKTEQDPLGVPAWRRLSGLCWRAMASLA